MNTKNTFHIISLERKMIWVFDVISDHFSTGHTHFPTQSHAHIIVVFVAYNLEGVADMYKKQT